MSAGRFLTALDVELVADTDPPIWRLLAPLRYDSAAAGVITVPAGFETDFASVPRLPLVFLAAGDTCHRAAVIHDWLYSPPAKVSRKVADQVLREASEATGVSWWQRWLVWAGVRICGAWAFQRNR